MKKNKLIYLSVFALTFFMFLGNVSADGCCIKENGTYTYQEPKTNNIINRYAPQITQTEICNILKDTGNYQDVIYVKDEATCKAKNNAASAANISTTTSNYKCCYKENGVYKFSSIAENICRNNLNGDTNLTQEQCIAKNPDVCCDTKTGTEKNGLTDTECASKGYKKVTAGTCSTASTTTNTNSKGCCMVQNQTATWYQKDNESACNDLANQGYGYSRGYVTQNECKNISQSTGNGELNVVTNNPSYDTDVTPQERDGVDDWGMYGNPTDNIPDMQVDLGCEGMKEVLGLVKTIYNIIRYATPLVLIILGSVDFMKAVMSGKEDEIKKNQNRFISRLILAVGVFLLLSAFELITNILSKSGVDGSDSWYDCWSSLMIMFK